MTPAQLHALLDCHRIATRPAGDAEPEDTGPGAFATREGLMRLSQMPYGG